MRIGQSLDERIASCEAALGEGAKFKVQFGGTSPVVDPLQEAYDIATVDPPLPPPWPQVAAYRLGHIKMRDARSFDELSAVDELFQKATLRDESVLGPMPSIYRMAVLLRMAHAAPSESLASGCKALLSTIFKRLSASFEDRRWEFNGTSRKSAIQGQLHNYLELVSYFTGEPYGKLQGMSSPFGDMMLPDEWRIVSSGGTWMSRYARLSWQFARTELEARSSVDSPVLLFEFGKTRMGETASVWMPDQEPARIPLRPMLLLLKYCTSPRAGSQELERSVIPAGQEGGSQLKTVLRDLKNSLGPYAHISGRDVITKGTRGAPARLSGHVQVIGMVHHEMLEASPPALTAYELANHQ